MRTKPHRDESDRGRTSQAKGRYFAEAPETAAPNRMIRIACLEFDPHVSSNRRNREEPGLQTRIGHAWISPTLRAGTENRGYRYANASQLFRIYVIDYFAAVFSVESVHGTTNGVIEPTPSRVSVNCCLY